MSPPGHHDSFVLPNGANGANGHRASEAVHASAKRGLEGGAIKVDADGVRYEQEGTKAEFTDRGASVTREFQNLPSERRQLYPYSRCRRSRDSG